MSKVNICDSSELLVEGPWEKGEYGILGCSSFIVFVVLPPKVICAIREDCAYFLSSAAFAAVSLGQQLVQLVGVERCLPPRPLSARTLHDDGAIEGGCYSTCYAVYPTRLSCRQNRPTDRAQPNNDNFYEREEKLQDHFFLLFSTPLGLLYSYLVLLVVQMPMGLASQQPVCA